MGRPVKALSWTLIGNYPDGPNLWNSKPVALAPPGTWFAPNLKPAAEEFNWLFGTTAADLQNLQDYAGNASAQNWTGEFVPLGSRTGFGAAAWDPLNSMWLVGLYGASATHAAVYTSTGAGGSSEWAQIGADLPGLTATSFINAVCVDNSIPTQFYAAVADGSGGSAIFTIDTSTVNPWAITTTFNLNPNNSVEMRVFNGDVIAFVAGLAPSTVAGVTYTGNHGATWTNTAYGLVACDTNWIVAQSATIVVAMPAMSAATHYLTTVDGHNYATRTFPGGMIGTHDAPAGIAWCDSLGLFILAVNKNLTSSPTTCQFYSSTDGLGWTAVGTGIPTVGGGSWTVSDLAAIGSLLLAISVDSATRSSTMIFSVDGAATWYPVQANFTDNAVSSAIQYMRPTVVASPTNFVALNTKVMRISDFAGLPAAAI